MYEMISLWGGLGGLVGLVGLAISSASLWYARYTNKQKQNLERLVKLRAWELYHAAEIATGYFNDLKAVNNLQEDRELIGRTYSLVESLYKDTVENVIASYEKTSPEIVDEWIKVEKIPSHARSVFLKSIG